MKWLFVVGIRSQYMKIAAFQKYIAEWNASKKQNINLICVNAGQHYDEILSGSFIKELGIQFDIDLTNSYSSRNPGILFAEMVSKLYELIKDTKPDCVIVAGDANTTLCGALAASRANVRLVHIESGVRTYDLDSGEEKNRIAVDHLANIRFLSSKSDQTNLLSEGLKENNIWSGDLIYDLILRYAVKMEASPLRMPYDSYILASIHRKENLLSSVVLKNIFKALSSTGFPVIFLAHPTTKKRIIELNLQRFAPNVEVVEGLSYFDTLATIKNARYLVTDSGAFQRESYYLKKRCLIRQHVPFWGALIKSEIHKAIGVTIKDINEGIKWVEKARECEYPVLDEYGDGKASFRITNELLNILGQ